MEFHRDVPSRFGVIPRYGTQEQIKWFEFEPGYVLHMVNAWEEGDWITMDGCFQPDPTIRRDPSEGQLGSMLAYLRYRGHLRRWRMNVRTGEKHEQQLDDLNVEFCLPDTQLYGVKTRYSYHQRIPTDLQTLVFDGLVKYDHESGAHEVYEYPKGWYGNEAPFAKSTRGGAEDRGYVVTLATRGKDYASEAWIFDAQRIGKGPIARVSPRAACQSAFTLRGFRGNCCGQTRVRLRKVRACRRRSPCIRPGSIRACLGARTASSRPSSTIAPRVYPSAALRYSKMERNGRGRMPQHVRAQAAALSARCASWRSRRRAWLPNGPALVRAWFSINYLGAMFVPLNTAYRGATSSTRSTRAGRSSCCTPALIERLAGLSLPHPERVDRIGTDSLEGDARQSDDSAQPQPWDPQSIIYTSGNDRFVEALSPYLQLYTTATVVYGYLREGEGILVNLPMFHVGGTSSLMIALIRSGSFYLVDGFSTDRFWDQVRRGNRTTPRASSASWARSS